MLKVGELRRHEGRVWRVTLVNASRARLDPVSGYTVASPVSGKSFTSYGDGVNVSPNSEMPLVDESELDEKALSRLVRMEETAHIAQEAGHMAGVAAPPVTGAKTAGASLKETNDARRAKLAADKAAAKAVKDAEKAAKKAEPKQQNACKCGCGGLTGGYFVPGHDARFKSWLLQIERGEKKPEEVLTPEVRASYKWKKAANGKGLIPTLNYKGEAWAGFEPAA